MKIERLKMFENNIQNTIFSEYFDNKDKIQELEIKNDDLRINLLKHINSWLYENYEYLDNKYGITDNMKNFILGYTKTQLSTKKLAKKLKKIVIDTFYLNSTTRDFTISGMGIAVATIVLDNKDIKDLISYIETHENIKTYNI